MCVALTNLDQAGVFMICDRSLHRQGLPGVFSAGLLLSAYFALLTSAPRAPAQTFKIIHEFPWPDGSAQPAGGTVPGGLTLGPRGELYGVAQNGGEVPITGKAYCPQGCGIVYELSPVGTEWQFAVLHSFKNAPDGAFPYAPMILGTDGSLYGTTIGGGFHSDKCPSSYCGGTVFKLQPCSFHPCRSAETVLYRFPGGSAGEGPGFEAPVTFDDEGNIYGTTEGGGFFGGSCSSNTYGCGVVFELAPSAGDWRESVLYAFGDNAIGINPTAGVVFDKQGNLYGTTMASDVYQLSPSASGWNYNVLLTTPDEIQAGVILDNAGDIFGVAETGGQFDGGSAFEISAGGQISDICNFPDYGDSYLPGPAASLVMDAAGNLYGTTNQDGAYGLGTVFRLSPNGDSGTYTYTDLHDFSGPDGYSPLAPLVLDKHGNIFGTTYGGGPMLDATTYSFGVVFEITAN